MHSSIGLPNGPFQALLLVPFGWLGASPPLMTVGVGMLNVLAVALVYGFTRDFFGRRPALVAMLLVAINPWAVILSRRLGRRHGRAVRRIDALDALPLALSRRRPPVAGGGDRPGDLIQVYIVGLEWLIVAALAGLLGVRRLRTRWALLALLLFAGLSAPYAVGAALPHARSLAGVNNGTSGPVSDRPFRRAVRLRPRVGGGVSGFCHARRAPP